MTKKPLKIGQVVRRLGSDDRVRIVRLRDPVATCCWTDADGVAHFQDIRVELLRPVVQEVPPP